MFTDKLKWKDNIVLAARLDEFVRRDELILLEMYFLLKSSFSRTNTQPYKLPVGAKISGLGALRVNKGKLFFLHLKSDKAIESGLWPILNPPRSLLTAYHRLCFCL